MIIDANERICAKSVLSLLRVLEVNSLKIPNGYSESVNRSRTDQKGQQQQQTHTIA